MLRFLQQSLSTIFHFITASYFQETPNLSLASRKMKNIVILGGSYAGISTAHRILKHAGKTAPFKITLVSPNTHFYWSMAAARGLVPGQISDEQLFRPIAEGFEQYPVRIFSLPLFLSLHLSTLTDSKFVQVNQFNFVLGSAESVNVETKHVRISGSTGTSTLDYDFLIIATGSRAKGDTPFKGVGSTEDTKAARHGFHARVEKAKTIVVAGGGVTGCETAGELAYEYGREKEITFVGLSLHAEISFTAATDPFYNHVKMQHID
jgi:apoptosis-inducing factor 2